MTSTARSSSVAAIAPRSGSKTRAPPPGMRASTSRATSWSSRTWAPRTARISTRSCSRRRGRCTPGIACASATVNSRSRSIDVLRVAEQYAVTDTGRQRRANEDSLLAHSPLFVVADGMGGAQAGEVASRLAVDEFRRGLREGDGLEGALAQRVREANARIYERSQRRAEQAGMGTTLTAIHVGPERVSVAHVGDSRAYRLRDGQLERLTEDHTLVDELIPHCLLHP